MTKRVAILISGGGSNMTALIDSMTGDHPARPVLVFSNVPDAGGLGIARDRGVAVAAVDHRPFGDDRAAFEAELHQALVEAAPDIICHAGFMRILTPEFVGKWAGKMLNVHPSLLPKYKGLNTHARVLAAGDATHGCTIHEVTAELDGGPILGQAELRVRGDDTVERLARRVLALEHQLYPAVLRRFAGGDRSPLSLSFSEGSA